MVKNVLALAALLGTGLLYRNDAYTQTRAVLEGRSINTSRPAVRRTGTACAAEYGDKYACVTPELADKLGLTNRVENKDRRNYTTRDADACPSTLICAGPIANIGDLETAVAEAQAALKAAQERIIALEETHTEALADYDQFMLGLKDSEPCKKAYAGLETKLGSVKDNFKAIEGIKEQLRGVLEPTAAPALEEVTPAQALQGISAPAEKPIGNLTEQLDEKIRIYEQSKHSFEQERARLLKVGCGQNTIIKQGGEFVFAPFAAYAFSQDAENQGRLGISAGYQVGRWTPGLRAAAILQNADVDVDTDRSGIQTANLSGDVQKTTADITKTTVETKDFVAVGPELTYSRGRVDLGAGVDALIGQRITRKDYTGAMRLTKDGQQLDGKKTIEDSTTDIETWYGANFHGGFNVKTLGKLRLGIEGGYSTRSKSAQGIFEIRYKF